MSTQEKKTIGILGGMGPLATADLFQKIVLLTKADTDREHIRVYIDSNANIPDRTAAILSGGEDPVPEMASALRKIFWKERVNQMKTLDLYLNEQLKNEEFRKEWEENQPEMDIIRAMADARISQNLTQKELAERTGINQADISKRENGTRNPSLKLLKRLADGMGMDLKLVFTPKEPQNLKLAK